MLFRAIVIGMLVSACVAGNVSADELDPQIDPPTVTRPPTTQPTPTNPSPLPQDLNPNCRREGTQIKCKTDGGGTRD